MLILHYIKKKDIFGATVPNSILSLSTFENTDKNYREDETMLPSLNAYSQPYTSSDEMSF